MINIDNPRLQVHRRTMFVKSSGVAIRDVHHGELTCRPREDRSGVVNEVRDDGSNEERDNRNGFVFI